VYHNLTAHYNAYYNGRVSLDEAIEEIKEIHKDDYTQVLDVFQLATKDDVKASTPKLDRAIMKSSIVIQRHSMYFGKKENVKWVFYSYMMIGKSRFYKHEYGIAKQVFQYVVTQYPKEDVKYDARMWIARVQAIEGEYDEALGNLDGIKSRVAQGLTSKEVYRTIPMVYADIYIKSKNYEAAIPHLKEAIDRNHNKEIRARMLFILGQLQQNRQRLKAASRFYATVLKNNPSYVMDFNARIKMAECYTGGDSKEVYKQLNKMLKDIKNVEFKDQIYYALAQIALKEKETDKAVDYLKKSVASSVSNEKQKAFSALQLADIYFEKEKYPLAQAYYDSTMLFLPKSYPDYDKLNNRKIILTQLVGYLITVQTEDSLQQMAALSVAERNRLIDNYIEELRYKEKKAAEAERERMENLQFLETNRQGPRSVTSAGASKWYFYNTASLSAGRTEFIKKWGNRKLEDDWRRKDKQQTSAFNQTQTDDGLEGDSDGGNTQDSSRTKSVDKYSRVYYLQDIPLTAAMMDSSNARIENALFGMGVIYKEKLKNLDKAATSFEKLIDRYPKGVFTPQAYYHLYQIYNLQGITSEANRYKKLLIKEYPETDYAKILEDPDYFEKLAKQANYAKDFYKKTYELYRAGNYAQVKKNCKIAKIEHLGTEDLGSKFEMLKALSIGKTTTDTAVFIEALNVVIQKYPSSEVKPIAEAIVLRLQKATKTDDENTSETDGTSKGANEPATIFVFDENASHKFIILADQRNVKIRELTKRLSDHNRRYFALNNLKINSLPINENMLLVSVNSFENKEESLDYFKTIRRNTVLYGMIRRVGGNYFVISKGNYKRLYKSKDLVGYRQFFEKYYPEGK